MAPTQLTLSAMIFGGISLVAMLLGLFYWRSGPKAIGYDPKLDQSRPKKVGDEKKEEKKQPSPKKEDSKEKVEPSVVLAEDDEEEEEDEEAKLKEEYDDAIRLAKKYLSGNKYDKAAEKFTAAIDIAPNVSSASKDIVTLYNNRSAMYEKCSRFDEALSDISVVLAMDGLHCKARVRRARINEVKGEVKSALHDLITVTMIERSRNQNLSADMTKIENLSRAVTTLELAVELQKQKSLEKKDLPSRAHVRNFLDSFSAYHVWQRQFASVERSELEEAVNSRGGVFASGESWTDVIQQSSPADVAARFETILVLCFFDLVKGSYHHAFEVINRACAVLIGAGEKNDKAFESLLDAKEDFKRVVSDFFELSGTECQLKGDFINAKLSYERSINLKPLPLGLDASLKLASILIETGDIEKGKTTYDEILATFADAGNLDESEATTVDGSFLSCQTAWTLIHRLSLWTSRDETGKLKLENVENSIVDIEEALKITELDEDEEDEEKKACHLIAILKMCHILTQTKSQVGMTPTEEDQVKVRSLTEAAKKLAPMHETVRLLEADFLCMEGAFDAALVKCDEIVADADPLDAVPFVIKGSILAQNGMMQFQTAQQMGDQSAFQKAQESFASAQAMYDKAMSVEPNGLEALVQYAQLKSVIGDVAGTLALTMKAIPHARSREELSEILQMKVMAQAQVDAVEDIQSCAN